MHRLFQAPVELLRGFCRQTSGNVAMLFALTLIPVVGLVGAAIDYSRANSIKANMQAAADATALAMAKVMQANPTLGNSQLQTQADAYYKALITAKDATNLVVSASYSNTSGSTVQVTGTGSMKTRFMGLLGFDQIALKSFSTTAWGSAKLRVALALDNTGSMAYDGKIDALKTATTGLLTQMKKAAVTTGDVYVSIVPFSRDINVGSSNASADWVNNWSEWETEPMKSDGVTVNTPSMSVGPGSYCPYSVYSDGYGCTTGPVNGSSSTSTIPSSGTYKGYICPDAYSSSNIRANKRSVYHNGCYTSTQYYCKGNSCSCSGHSHCTCSGNGSNKVCATDSGYWEHAWVVNDHSTWNGCVSDRGNVNAPGSNGYDQKTTAPTVGVAESIFPPDQYSMCTQSSAGLKDVMTSSDFTAMNSLVNSMTPVGSTNQPIGLVWAWQTLVGGGPFTVPSYSTASSYTPIIILLSDGLNTQDRWYGNGNATSTQVDSRMLASNGSGTCANIKNTPISINGVNTNIVIFTVQVNTTGDPTSTLLKNCASPDDVEPKGPKFFLLTSADQIVTTFQTIGTSLTKLRVAK